MGDGIKEVWFSSPLLDSEKLSWGTLVEKVICCEISSVGTLEDLVNGSVQPTCSSHDLHQTYDKGLVDNMMGRLSWVHTL
jgi:hypothetical protein